MFNLRKFKKLYLQLQDKESYSYASFLVVENLPCSIEYFFEELNRETDKNIKTHLVATYNQFVADNHILTIQSFLKKDYLSLPQVFALLTSFVFQKEPYAVHRSLIALCDRLIKRLDKNILENGSPTDIIAEFNHKITQSLVLDNGFLGYYDFTEVSDQHIISEYTYAIIFLIIAEKLNLPIYGLPFDDKLVLCYTENYCTHSELVSQDDILHYIVLGEKDLIYNLNDIKLLAYLHEEQLRVGMTLPRSTQKVMEGWLTNLCQSDFDSKTTLYLSSIYQQIFELAEEF